MQNAFFTEVWFTGRVQGVGFRYMTLQVAKGYDVSGTVENLADGRVRMTAEGEIEEVQAFVAEVGKELAGYIRKTEMRTETRRPRLKGFRII